jgi:hypothetical protein
MSKEFRGTSRARFAAGYFFDPETGERLPDDTVFDTHGVELIGADDSGLWWGTERACWVLSERGAAVRASGFIGSETWDGFFIGSESEAKRYAETHSVREVKTETLRT